MRLIRAVISTLIVVAAIIFVPYYTSIITGTKGNWVVGLLTLIFAFFAASFIINIFKYFTIKINS